MDDALSFGEGPSDTPRRYPFAPMERVLKDRLGDVTDDKGQVLQVGGPTMARFLGEHPRQIQRWRNYGVTRDQADRLAVKVGVPAYSLWPEMLDEVISEVTCGCEAVDCPETFTVSPFGRGGKGKRFCSDTCRARMSMRRFRATPEGKARNLAYNRRYKQEVAEMQARRASLKRSA